MTEIVETITQGGALCLLLISVALICQALHSITKWRSDGAERIAKQGEKLPIEDYSMSKKQYGIWGRVTGVFKRNRIKAKMTRQR